MCVIEYYRKTVLNTMNISLDKLRTIIVPLYNNKKTLRWRHDEHDVVSNHQSHDCLLNFYSGADQRKHQSSASLAFARGIHRASVNSPHKGPVTRKMFPFDDIIMRKRYLGLTGDCFTNKEVSSPQSIKLAFKDSSLSKLAKPFHQEVSSRSFKSQ